MIHLPDRDGREIRLSSLWLRQTAIIVFLRDYGGIFCREDGAAVCARTNRHFESGALYLQRLHLATAPGLARSVVETGITYRCGWTKTEARIRQWSCREQICFSFWVKTTPSHGHEPRCLDLPSTSGARIHFNQAGVWFLARLMWTASRISAKHSGEASLSYRRSLIFPTFGAVQWHLTWKGDPSAHPLRTISAPVAPFASAPGPFPKFDWSDHR
jgi:hypothetical protein